MKFKDKLKRISLKNNSLVCVGLDSDFEKIPQHLKSKKHPQFEFNKAIIDSSYDLVCAYKPNSAFYEAEGAEGIFQLKMTCDYLTEEFPEIPVIIDAKRADIGSTNMGYIKFVFSYLNADAITLHWYVGKQGLKPFLDLNDKGLFVYCRSSNAGAGEFQDLIINGKPFYRILAEKVVKDWNANDNCGLIFGATYPDELKIVRHIAPELPFLIPGIGAQGGNIEKTVKAGTDNRGLNAVINSSRGIIFAGYGTDFAKKARQEAQKLRDEINKYR